VGAGHDSVHTVHNKNSTVKAILLARLREEERRFNAPSVQIVEGACSIRCRRRGALGGFGKEDGMEAGDKGLFPAGSVRGAERVDAVYPPETRIAPDPSEMVPLNVAWGNDEVN